MSEGMVFAIVTMLGLTGLGLCLGVVWIAFLIRRRDRRRRQQEGNGIARCPECERSYGPHYRGPCNH